MELEIWRASEGEQIPNHPSFPILVYHGVPEALAGLDECRALFADNGWLGSWVSSVFGFHHFHSTSHEVLGVVGGQATLELGGPQGRAFEVRGGDVVVLPAGTGHRRARSDPAFTVLGAYPAGQEAYDLLRWESPAAVLQARKRIAALGAPPRDPVGGEGVVQWRR